MSISGRMGRRLNVGGIKIRQMAEGAKSNLEEDIMKVIIKMTKSLAMEFYYMQMVINMRGHGEMIKSTVLVVK